MPRLDIKKIFFQLKKDKYRELQRAAAFFFVKCGTACCANLPCCLYICHVYKQVNK